MICLIPCAAFSEELWSVSAKKIEIDSRDKIIGFRIRLKSASIDSLTKIPISWSICVSNFLNEEPEWNTSLDASVGVGAAYIEPKYFNNFIRIEKYAGRGSTEMPLDVELKITVTTDFEATRDIVIPMSGLKILQVVNTTKKTRK